MNLSKSLLALAAVAAALVSVRTASAAVETYTIDPVHSSVAFSIRHVIGKVPGSFTKFSGTIVADRDNLEKSTVQATIDVASVSTNSEKRDGHLKTPDFFDAAKYPTITFTSKAWKKTGDSTFDVTGFLTIKGITEEVVLKVSALGFGPGMMGKPISAWEATTVINRHDFGVNGPAMLGNALGDDVSITIEIEGDLSSGS